MTGNITSNVRFGIVGLGMGRARAERCTKTPGAELVAISDLSEERGKKVQDALGAQWVRDYDDLVSREDIDVIGIWSPSGTHASMAIKALDAGKHVCMTKPMDLRTDVCDQVITTAEQRGLVLAVDFDSRYNPANYKICKALQSKAIGDIIFADLRMKWYRGQDYYDGGMPAGWRGRLNTEGGSLANQAVHYIDLLQWWLGPVSRVIGKYGTHAHDIETEDGAIAILEFQSGANAVILTTTCSFPPLKTTIEITGKKGSLAWKEQNIESFVVAKPPDMKGPDKQALEFKASEARELDIEDFPAPRDLPANIIEDMVGAVRDGKPVQCDGHEGRRSVAIVEAIYSSSDHDQWTKL